MKRWSLALLALLAGTAELRAQSGWNTITAGQVQPGDMTELYSNRFVYQTYLTMQQLQAFIALQNGSVGAGTQGQIAFYAASGTALSAIGPFVTNLPVIGNGAGGLASGTRSGSTTNFATVSGALTNGHCVSVGSAGDLVDAGASCTTGGGGGTVNAAAKNQLAFYNAAGNAVSGTSAFATPVPAACNGSTDDTSVINTTLASMSQGVAQLPPGNCKISGTINIPNFVTLRGQGSGLAWSTIGVGSSDDTYPTRLVWTGGATASVVSFAALAQDSGLADLTVDGGITSGYGSSSIVGVSLTSCHGVRLSNVSIQYVGVGVQLAPPGGAGSNCSWNRFYDTRILHVRSGIIFNPTGSASPSGATDNFFYNTWIYDYALYGVGFSNLSDDNHFFGSYVSTLVQNSIGIVLNYSTPTTQNGVYSNDFYDVVMDIFNNNGSTYSIIVNATGDTGSTVGQSSRFSGYISTAGTNINPPIVQNSGRAIFNINDGLPPSVTTCGSGASVVGNEYDGRIQVGSGSVTSCQLNWNTQASSTGFARAPSCVVSASSGAFGISVSPSTTSLALTFTTSAGSAVLSYHCTPL